MNLFTDEKYNLARCYHYGIGVERNIAKAIDLYTKSSEQGNSNAQFNLAEIYRKGEGVHKDLEKAKKWYRKSAEQGNSNAQLLLGMVYDKHMFNRITELDMRCFTEAKQLQSSNTFKSKKTTDTTEQKMQTLSIDTAAYWYSKAAENGHAIAKY